MALTSCMAWSLVGALWACVLGGVDAVGDKGVGGDMLRDF